MSLHAYLKERRLALGKSITHRHKVYLDTKYWLLLRNHSLGRSGDPAIAELSLLLHDGVRSGKLICPISADIVLEILTQRDPLTLDRSVQLIDTLSEGVTVLPPIERARMELLHFVRKSLFGKAACHSPEVFVWTKVAYALGFMTPCRTPLSPERELIIQKTLMDRMWEISLSDLVHKVGVEAIREMPRMPDISAELNAEKFARADEVNSFEAVWLSEIAGVLDTLKSDFREMFAYLYESENPLSSLPIEKDLLASDGARLLTNLIYEGFRLKRFSTELPSVGIPATIHAAIRWQTDRKYKRTDIHDFDHAEAALPYFDTFLTEHSLRHLLTRSDLALDLLYKCRVVSDPSSGVAEIEKALSQSRN